MAATGRYSQRSLPYGIPTGATIHSLEWLFDPAQLFAKIIEAIAFSSCFVGVQQMHQDSREIRNNSDHPIEVWVEPWAFALEVPSRSALLFEADSGEEGCLEIIESDGPVIFAWPGANLRVTRDGVVVYETDIRPPRNPPGMTMKQVLELILGYLQPPKTNLGEP